MWHKYIKVIGVLGLLVVAATGYFAAAELDTNNHTYNTSHGFSVGYPTNYMIFQQGENFVQFVKEKSDLEGEIASIMVIVRDNPDWISTNEWFEKNPEYYVGDRQFKDVANSGSSDLVVSGKQYTSITYKGMGELKTAIMEHGDKIVEVTAHTLSNFENDHELLTAYNYILGNIDDNKPEQLHEN